MCFENCRLSYKTQHINTKLGTDSFEAKIQLSDLRGTVRRESYDNVHVNTGQVVSQIKYLLIF